MSRAGIIRARWSDSRPDCARPARPSSQMTPHGATFLALPGPSALSAFRAARLLRGCSRDRAVGSLLRTVHPLRSRDARARRRRAARGSRTARLWRCAGRRRDIGAGHDGRSWSPRLGTISPWASKATDIAHNTGLTAIQRIERGTLYTIEFKRSALRPSRPVAADSRSRIEPLSARSHDRERDRSGDRSGAPVQRSREQAAADRRMLARWACRARAGQSRARPRAFRRRDRLPGRRFHRNRVAIRPMSS